MSEDLRKRLMTNGEEPKWYGSEIPKRGFVPYCSREDCRQFDGKRCALTGGQPDTICTPAVARMSEALDDIEGRIR